MLHLFWLPCIVCRPQDVLSAGDGLSEEPLWCALPECWHVTKVVQHPLECRRDSGDPRERIRRDSAEGKTKEQD